MSISAVIEKFERASFAWGEVDCALFAFEGALAAGGADLRRALPRYSSAAGALRCLRARGCVTLADFVGQHAREIGPAQAMPGDVAWIADGGMGCLGLVVGADALFLSPAGLVRRPILQCRVWRA